MTKKKKIVIIAVHILLAVLLCGIYAIRENDRFGLDLYNVCGTVSVQSSIFADGIEFTEKEFRNDDGDVNTYPFEYGLLDLHSGFGYNDMPMLDEVRLDWINEFERLFRVSLRDEDIATEFTEPEKLADLLALKDQLQNLSERLTAFRERYEQTSEWDRHFISWRDERNKLSEALRLAGD